MTERDQREVTLSEAARKLGMSWQRAWRLMLIGELAGRRENGRWFVTCASVERVLRAQAADRPRAGAAR
jgi:hypothetical protein